jgi:cyclophilin family peptidyl-prolyl cis-trans isomerase
MSPPAAPFRGNSRRPFSGGDYNEGLGGSSEPSARLTDLDTFAGFGTMLKRFSAAAALLLLIHTGAVAQTLRFTTNVGAFDMVLNPTNDPNLQPLVDNMVAYVGLGKYHFSALNRAADGNPGASDDFVLQMGSFLGFPRVPDLWVQNLPSQSIQSLTPVTTDANGDGQVDFATLSNTRGMVSLALQSGNPNSGTSSFFVNLGDNSFLDSQGFVPFARIDNMNTIDQIMQLAQRDLSGLVGQTGNLAISDVPLDSDGEMVVVTAVQVLDPTFSFTGPIANALRAQENQSSAAALAAASLANSSQLETSSEAVVSEDPPAAILPPVGGGSPTQTAVPEPAAVTLGLLGLLGAFAAARKR